MTPELDRSVAVLIVKVGRYPLHHGGVAAIRTLGRLGVPVHAICEDRFTPAALSRYVRKRFVWPTTGGEDADDLVAGLLAISDRLDGRVIALPTDDEAAVLLAEHTAALAGRFEFPDVPPELPRVLADKFSLHELCGRVGVPSPASARPASVEELLAVAEKIGYPVVLKNAQPWSRLNRPAVRATTMVSAEAEMRSLAGGWGVMPGVLVQEYLPMSDQARDWISQVYCDASSKSVMSFTGVKVRSWPPRAGVTTRAYTAANEELAEMTRALCHNIAYRGIGDLDWRFDPADGRYKLLDFNPRVGAQFRLFETETGIDVVRAMHLDLTGRPVSPLPQIEGRGLRVENLDVPAVWDDYRHGAGGSDRIPRGKTELAWLAIDDPLPAVAAAVWSSGPAMAMLGRRLSRTSGAASPNRAGTGR